MYSDITENANMNTRTEEDKKIILGDMFIKKELRALDMQQVVGQKLAANQQAVNNAENYPSTWTTNPDGGANGQV